LSTTEIDGQEVSLLDTIGFDGLKVSLFDTIDFDDAHRSDTKTLREISSWLADTYVHGVRLAGVLYMHNIDLSGLSGPQLRNMRIVRKLVGEEQLSNVTLVATQWNAVDTKTGKERRRQLRQWDYLRGAMVDWGSTIEPFNGTREGAHNILRKILSKERKAVLNIQREMLDQELKLSETAAGKLIREDIEKLQEYFPVSIHSCRVFGDGALAILERAVPATLPTRLSRLLGLLLTLPPGMFHPIG
jgi:hypothetical protein